MKSLNEKLKCRFIMLITIIDEDTFKAGEFKGDSHFVTKHSLYPEFQEIYKQLIDMGEENWLMSVLGL